ncbi:MAG: hypothetical protein KDD82_28860 [Planctomycetes bacterium]|nr:hypothetical protein [Planctomycetota bacterium]
MLILPDGGASSTAFDQDFFRREFKDGDVPRCDLLAEGPVSVVELVLVNGDTLDINAFEEFRRGYIVATVFADPPACDDLYRAYIRYDAVFQVNVRTVLAEGRLGFHKHPPVIEADE